MARRKGFELRRRHSSDRSSWNMIHSLSTSSGTGYGDPQRGVLCDENFTLARGQNLLLVKSKTPGFTPGVKVKTETAGAPSSARPSSTMVAITSSIGQRASVAGCGQR